MGIYFGGVEYTGIHIRGQEFSGLELGGAGYISEADVPGTLSIAASVARGTRNFNFSIVDTNGIRSITSATLEARDGTSANVLTDFARTDANTFAGTDSRRNARWNRGMLTVTYVDAASGNSHTLTATWSI